MDGARTGSGCCSVWLSVCVSSVAHTDHQHDEPVVLDFVNDTLLTNTNAKRPLASPELAAASRARLIPQASDCVDDSNDDTRGQVPKFATCRTPPINPTCLVAGVVNDKLRM